MSLETVPSNRK